MLMAQGLPDQKPVERIERAAILVLVGFTIEYVQLLLCPVVFLTEVNVECYGILPLNLEMPCSSLG